VVKIKKVRCKNCGTVREVTITQRIDRRETRQLGRKQKQITYHTGENWDFGVCKKCGRPEFEPINPNDNDEPKTDDEQ